VTVVDAKHLVHAPRRHKPEGVENEAVEQLAFADRSCSTRSTSPPASTSSPRSSGGSARSTHLAPIVRTSHGKVDLDAILDVGAFDLDRVLADDPEFLDPDAEHQHDLTVTSVGHRADGEVDVDKLNDWLGALLRERGVDIFRSKGILSIAGVGRPLRVPGGAHAARRAADRPWRPRRTPDEQARVHRPQPRPRRARASFRACLV
jgi:G3E family GTPase